MILHDPDALRAVLKRHGLRAEKGLGQHFLVSEPAVRAIVGATEGVESVLEIGPGPGVLTRPLSESGLKVVALELDPRFVAMLMQTAPRAEIRFQDALKTDLATVLDELPGPRAIVSNLPYYITAPLIGKIVEQRFRIDRAVLMMQKEVALRIVAPPGDGDRGSLSVYLQAQFTIRRVANVHSSAFLPPPKVDSMVLCLTPRDTGWGDDEAWVLRVIRLGFTQPRKTLANNLSAAYHLERTSVLDLLESLGHGEKVRAGELTLDHWAELARALRGILPSNESAGSEPPI